MKQKNRNAQELLQEFNDSAPQMEAQIRAVRLEEGQRADGADEYRFEISASSEFPVLRWGVVEILSHEPGAVRLERITSGNSPFLWMHRHNEPIGIIESFSIVNGRGTAGVRFGKSDLAQEKRQDVIDGILTNISIGYRVHGDQLVETAEGKPPVFRVVDWEPYEVSLVTVPADPSVGTNRSDPPTKRTPKPQPKKVRTMNEFIKKTAIRYGMDPENCTEQQVLDKHAENASAKGEQRAADAAAAELARRDAITAAGKECELPEMARKFIDDGKTVDEFRAAALADLNARRVTTTVGSARSLSRTELKDLESFSLARYILGATGERLDGLEAEIAVEATRESEALGLGVGPGYLPSTVVGEIGVRAEMHRASQTRAQVVGTDTAGGFLVGTENMGLIGALKSRLWMTQLGVKILSGLRNNITLPGIDVEGEAESLTETENMTGAAVTLNQRTLSPNRVGTQVTFGLQLLRQSSPQIEGVLADLVYGRIARKYNADAIAFLVALAGTNSVVTGGAALTRTMMRQFKTLVGADNADERPPSWLINSNQEGKLDTTLVDAGSGLFLYKEKENGEGSILNRRALTTNLMADANIIYGDMTRLWMGDWGGIDFVRDNVTKAKSGEIVLTANSFNDFAVENEEHFAIAKDVDPSA